MTSKALGAAMNTAGKSNHKFLLWLMNKIYLCNCKFIFVIYDDRLCLKDWSLSREHGFDVCNNEEDLGGNDTKLVQCETELMELGKVKLLDEQ